MIAGIAQKSWVTLLSLQSLKKQWWVYWYKTTGNIFLFKIFLLVLLLNTATTNNSNNNNNNNNHNNVIIIKMAITIKMKRGCALKKKLIAAIYIVRLISYSVKKMLLNSVLVSIKIICCFKEFGKLFQIIKAI